MTLEWRLTGHKQPLNVSPWSRHSLQHCLPSLWARWTMAVGEVFQTSKKIHLYPSNHHDLDKKKELWELTASFKNICLARRGLLWLHKLTKAERTGLCSFIMLCSMASAPVISSRSWNRWESGDTTFLWNGPMAFLALLANCTLSDSAPQEDQRLFPLLRP